MSKKQARRSDFVAGNSKGKTPSNRKSGSFSGAQIKTEIEKIHIFRAGCDN